MCKPSPTPARWRRWLRFRLRTLLVATVVVALAASYMGRHLARVRIERPIIAEIQAVGGWVAYCYQLESDDGQEPVPPGPRAIRRILGDDFFAAVHAVGLNASAPDECLVRLHELRELRFLRLNNGALRDGTVDHLLKIQHLQELDLQFTHITPDALRRLSQLAALERLELFPATDAHAQQLTTFSQLKSLELGGSFLTDQAVVSVGNLTGLRQLAITAPISNAGMAAIDPLRDLEQLSVTWTDVTDEGVRVVRRMHQLRLLSLRGSPITDQALDHLKELSHLETLNLDATLVTDAGLMKLRELKTLRRLDVMTGIGVTVEGVELLKTELPDCLIIYWASGQDPVWRRPSGWR